MGRQAPGIHVARCLTAHGSQKRQAALRWFTPSTTSNSIGPTLKYPTCFSRLNLYSLALAFASTTVAHATQRSDTALSDSWQFQKSEVASAETSSLDDSAWDTVTVPHTWNAVDAANGGGDQHDASVGYYRGPAWYRKVLDIPESDQGKQLFVRFGSASTVADVYVNGTKLGSHRGGFTAFSFEITDHVRFGQSNLLAVRVSNKYQADVPPLSGDFAAFGGLIRPVHLIVTDKACVTPLDFASSGVYFRQANVTAQSADLSITTKVANGYDVEQELTVRTLVQSADGKTVAQADTSQRIAAGETAAITQSAKISSPHLWQGLDDPYLYTLTTTVILDGKPVDTVSQNIGIRDFKIDPAKGAFLNGQHYPVHGMCRHEDRSGHGRALTKADHEEDMAIIREIGAKGLRLAHYPHSAYFLDLCDKEGLLVWSEIPIVDRITDNEAFSDNAKQQLTEMIRQKFNHPSIFCWSLWNELMHEPSPNPVALITELHKLAKSEDPDRPTVGAANWASQQAPGLRETADLTAWNKYLGWYGGEAEEMAEFMEKMNKLAGGTGLAISEYGAGGSLQHHEQGMTERPDTRGKWHPEEWQNHVHEVNFAAINDSPFVWGSFAWNMFDFASVWRDEGDTKGINDKGLVTYDRKQKKDAFYFYKAHWSDKPFVYISSRRHVERDEAVTNIKVYSNCQSVSLALGGKSLGSQTSDNRVFIWPSVELGPGQNTITVVGLQSDDSCSDECQWNLKPESASVGSTLKKSKFVPAGYQLAWSDEFSGTELDETKWSHRYPGKMRGQGLLSPDSVTLDGNGVLHLTTKKIDGVLHTGMLTSKRKYEPTFGYIESRVKFQTMQGHHGSVWLQTDTYNEFPGDPGKAGAEIDIAEFFGSGRSDRGVGVNLYWLDKDKKKQRVGTSKLNLDAIVGPMEKAGREICDDFHVFAVEWTDEGYKYFIDGHLMQTTDKGVSKRSQFLILSLLCHDWEAPRLKHDLLPDGMQVDYVRVYQR